MLSHGFDETGVVAKVRGDFHALLQQVLLAFGSARCARAGDSRCGRQHALWNDWDFVLAYDEPVDEELVPPTIIRQPGSKGPSVLELDVWRVLGEWTNVASLVTEPRFLFGEDNFSCQLCNRSFETEAEFPESRPLGGAHDLHALSDARLGMRTPRLGMRKPMASSRIFFATVLLLSPWSLLP